MLDLFKRKDKRTELEKEIHDVLKEMKYQPKDSKGYQQNVNTLKALYEAKSTERSRKISPDTKANIAYGIVSILLILGFEMKDHITSKAFPWIPKGRV